LKTYRAELHVHTVVSPCADIEMIPPLIVQEALAREIKLLAITDHNTGANVGAVKQAAAGADLAILPGMELQTREEVHLLCLFDTMTQLKAWQVQVDAHMPLLENNIDFFGEQFVVDETGEFIRRETQLLLTSANMSLKEAVIGVMDLGGLAIPAHVNRQAFSLIANLGLVPTDVPFEALEISRHITPAEACQKFPQLKGFPLIQNGDVHRLNEFLGATFFQLAAPTIAELRLAFLNRNGRSVTIRSLKS
jgi:PHP family Zn ribbon phosphoesterase